MKKLSTLFVLLLSAIVLAQVPQGISYQAIALNANSTPVVSSNVGLRLSILDNSATGSVLYTETHTKMTNAQGLFNLVIGQGTPTAGTFSGINWATNNKFLKVEMDATGGASYILVGSTQLLSVPYALAAKKLVLQAGEGITLTSPNGTPYQVTVNDSGQLSLPTSGATSTIPNSIYMYGSFNNFNASTSLLMSLYNVNGIHSFFGYKYLTAGTQLKFLSINDTSSPVYGVTNTAGLAVNGSAFNVASTGFYLIDIHKYNPGALSDYTVILQSSLPSISFVNYTAGPVPTYNSTTNTFTFIVNGVSSTNGKDSFYFSFKDSRINGLTQYTPNNWGDDLADGSIDLNGAIIPFPGVTTTLKNYKVELVLNFNGSGTYVITQIP